MRSDEPQRRLEDAREFAERRASPTSGDAVALTAVGDAPSLAAAGDASRVPRGDAPEPALVLERTSGDEHEDQDAKAQTVQTVHRAKLAGFDVRASETEEDVPGDTPWAKRPILQRALGKAANLGLVVVVREVSRLWRGRVAPGYALIESVRDLEVLGKAHWSRRAGAWVNDADSDELLRLIDLWSSWTEKRRLQERTALAMTEIKEGRRATRSGKPHHRPPKELIPRALEAAREAFFNGGASQFEAREEYRQASGYYTVTDPKARERRDVSRTVLIERLRELGAPEPAGKPDLSERGSASAGAEPAGRRSLADKGVGA